MVTRFLLVFLAFCFLSCNNDDDGTVENDNEDGEVTLEHEVNDFVWKGLNEWYLWQDSVDDLADDRFANDNAYHRFLNGYSSPEALFDDLLYTEADDFSWFIEDVEEQLNSFVGISTSYGLELGYLIQLNSSEIVIYVAYVVPGSPSALAGIERGDIIYSVNGVAMTPDNYKIINKIFTDETITLGFGTVSNGNLIPDPNDSQLTAVELTENPIHHFSVLEEGGKKIGYLVYNSFNSAYHSELNDIFGHFISEGINELVLDLRYNRGGSVVTSLLLASMIAGNVSSGQEVYAELRFNSKKNTENKEVYYFLDDVPVLDDDGNIAGTLALNRQTTISKLYVLTSDRTASASELIVNGLRPFMEVVLVGDRTVGKNVGSSTFVYMPSNPAKGNAYNTAGMQPIIFQSFNSLGQSDYSDGFIPDITVDERDYFDGILPFGDPNEALLSAALDAILGRNATSKSAQGYSNRISTFRGEIKQPKFSSEMYLMPGDQELLTRNQ